MHNIWMSFLLRESILTQLIESQHKMWSIEGHEEKLSKQVPFMFPINGLQRDISLLHLYRKKA